jgi:hypothetical protein
MSALVPGLTSGINGKKISMSQFFRFCDLLTYPTYLKYDGYINLSQNRKSVTYLSPPPRKSHSLIPGIVTLTYLFQLVPALTPFSFLRNLTLQTWSDSYRRNQFKYIYRGRAYRGTMHTYLPGVADSVYYTNNSTSPWARAHSGANVHGKSLEPFVCKLK